MESEFHFHWLLSQRFDKIIPSFPRPGKDIPGQRVNGRHSTVAEMLPILANIYRNLHPK